MYIDHIHPSTLSTSWPFIVINNPLSPISAAHMHIGVWLPIGEWKIQQWLLRAKSQGLHKILGLPWLAT